MSTLTLTPVRIAAALLISSLLVSACSSSSDNPSPTEVDAANSDAISMVEVSVPNSDVMNIDTNDSMSADVMDDGSPDDTTGEIGTEVTPLPDPPNSNPVVPDPMSQNTTRINFDIQVPAYQSNELQVGLTWGDKMIAAGWVGDEFWSASDDFPTDTQNLLIATFSDANGDTTLASFETVFRTGTNASMSYQITADQFDTNSWDSDGDGVSNLDELIAESDSSNAKRILLFTETREFRHESIADAVTTLEELANSAGIQTDHATDSSGVFNATNLANYDAVVWVLTSGDVLDANEQTAFENYIRSGGGYAGIHAASDTEYDWPWYGALVGAYFARHPEIQSASQNVEDASHPSTAHLNLTWTRTDEWYDYSINPRAQVNVLLSLDEDSYTGGGMGEDHPSAWYHAYDGGRSWYTGGGHTSDSYAEPDFRTHLLGGLRYATGLDGF